MEKQEISWRLYDTCLINAGLCEVHMGTLQHRCSCSIRWLYNYIVNLKSQERQQHYMKQTPDIIVDKINKVTMTQSLFLSRLRNKSQLIESLCKKLIQHSIQTSVASGDADVFIVKTIDKNVDNKTVVFVMKILISLPSQLPPAIPLKNIL